MAGLLDNLMGDSVDDPRTMGLLSLAASLSSGRKFMPALAQGLLARQGILADAESTKQKRAMMDLQMQQHQLQLQEAQRAAAQQQALADAAKASMRSPTEVGMAGGGGPTAANLERVQSSQPQFDWGGYASRVAGIDPMRALQIQQATAKAQPKLSKMEAMRGPNGELVNVAVFEDGTTKVLPYGVKPEMVAQDTGGGITFVDKNSVANGATLRKTNTPDAMLSANVTMRGQNMTDARAREANDITKQGQRTQVVSDPERGVMLVDKGTGLMRPALGLDGKPVPAESQVKREAAANRTLPLITEAEKLIDASTGSYIGAGIDQAAQAFGKATPGARASARLKVLEGQLMLSQPRMEGPQSDKDVQLYRQMAGQIGDPTVPAEIKREALKTIKTLQRRYAGLPDQEPAKSAEIPGVRFLGYE